MGNVAVRVEEKFLEVALDYSGMIPEISQSGCQIFCFDVDQIANLFQNSFDSYIAANPFSRLKDIVKLMSLEDTKFQSLRDAVRGLVGDPFDSSTHRGTLGPLLIEQLERDGTLFNET